MTLWKIEAKNNWNWGKGKELIKGMFVEMPTPSTAPPLGLTKYHETIAQLFNTKYGTNFDKSKINAGHFICTKIRRSKNDSGPFLLKKSLCFLSI